MVAKSDLEPCGPRAVSEQNVLRNGGNNAISRVSSISDGSGTLEGYDYLGLDTVVRRTHPQSGFDATFLMGAGDGGDQYLGLDRFGRVTEMRSYNGANPRRRPWRRLNRSQMQCGCQ